MIFKKQRSLFWGTRLVTAVSVLFLVNGLVVACGQSKGGGVRDLLCGPGQAMGQLTAGVNLGFLQSLGFSTSNDSVKEIINSSLAKAGVSTAVFQVASVESIDNSGDEKVRFLKVGGSFGAGFGLATQILEKAFGAATAQLTRADGTTSWEAAPDSSATLFSFLRESIVVSAMTAPVPQNTQVLLKHFHIAPLFRFSDFAVAPEGRRTPLDLQWALNQTDYEKAMTLLAPSPKSVAVAVLDTGVDLSHPDLKDVIVDPFDATTGGNVPQDAHGHGTHCAGIIAAQAQSGDKSPVGVAARSQVKIMPIKVLGDDGSGSTQNIDKGLRWAIKRGAQVISMSLGGGVEYKDVGPQGLKNPLIDEAIRAGIVVVVAAGNEGCQLGGTCRAPAGFFSKSYNEYTVLPCAYEGTICVGATDPQETLASYSNYSSKKSQVPYRVRADVNAPGTAIYSTWPTSLGGPYKAISGTSMATPFVAGAAALLKADNPALTQEEVRKIMSESLVEPSELVEKSEVGRLDLYKMALTYRHGQNPTQYPLPEVMPGPHAVELPPALQTPEGGGSSSVLVPLFTVWKVLCALP